MDNYTLGALILSLAVLLAYAYQRLTNLQTTVALMASSLLISMLLVFLNWMGVLNLSYYAHWFTHAISFHDLLLKGLLGPLLFAGSLQIDMRLLKLYRVEIAVFALLGTLCSTLIVGFAMFYLMMCFSVHVTLIQALIFGALISPTDPIAVLATFKKLKAPKSLEIIVSGESLFNDGIAIVVFLILCHIAFANTQITVMSVGQLFAREVLGGIFFGLGLGWVATRLIAYGQDTVMPILLTVAVATGGYTLANELDLSGALAMVCAGIMVGNYRRNDVLVRAARMELNHVWEVIDELLNAILFFLIGFELITLHLNTIGLILGALAVLVVFITRVAIIGAPMWVLKRNRHYPPSSSAILIWGGLRGGLAVALVLAIPHTAPIRDTFIVMTYVVVAFSVLLQGGTIKYLIEGAMRRRVK